MYHIKIKEFEENNDPKEANFKTVGEYVAASGRYTDTLAKRINFLLFLQDSFSKAPIKNVRQFEKAYIDLAKKK